MKQPILFAQIAHVLIVTMVSGLFIVSAGGLLLAKQEGAHLLSVQTGSMMPVFRAGDAVISMKTSSRSLRAGDIISYRSAANPALIITHRLIKIDPTTGWLVTKGDHNSRPDPTFPPRLVTGKVVAIAPHFGTVLDTARKPLGLVFLVYVPALAIIMFEIRRFLSQSHRLQYRLAR